MTFNSNVVFFLALYLQTYYRNTRWAQEKLDSLYEKYSESVGIENCQSGQKFNLALNSRSNHEQKKKKK